MDLRIVKTKHALREALIDLLSEKEIDTISVAELSRKANINRKTFYSHYESINELIGEIENEIICRFEKFVKTMELKVFFDNPFMFFGSLNPIITEDYKFYRNLLTNQQGDNLLKKIEKTIYDELYILTKDFKIFEEGHIEFILTYTVGGIIEVYRNLFSNDFDLSNEEISSYLQKITMSGINSFIIDSTIHN